MVKVWSNCGVTIELLNSMVTWKQFFGKLFGSPNSMVTSKYFMPRFIQYGEFGYLFSVWRDGQNLPWMISGPNHDYYIIFVKERDLTRLTHGYLLGSAELRLHFSRLVILGKIFSKIIKQEHLFFAWQQCSFVVALLSSCLNLLGAILGPLFKNFGLWAICVGLQRLGAGRFLEAWSFKQLQVIFVA